MVPASGLCTNLRTLATEKLEVRDGIQTVRRLFDYILLSGNFCRIAVVFNVSDGKPKAVTDNLVLQKLGMVVTPVVIYLVVWTVLSSPAIQMAHTAQGLKYYMCQENWMDYGIIVAECVFLIWGVVLSYQIRNVISTFNESKLVAWTIYNTIFMKNFLMIIR